MGPRGSRGPGWEGNMEQLYTPREAAAMLRASLSGVYLWVRQGRLRPQRVGNRLRFTESELHRFIAENGPRGGERA